MLLYPPHQLGYNQTLYPGLYKLIVISFLITNISHMTCAETVSVETSKTRLGAWVKLNFLLEWEHMSCMAPKFFAE